MNTEFQLFPDQASVNAAHVDALVFFMLGVSLFFIVLIAGLILYFGLRYRRKPQDAKIIPPPPKSHLGLEVAWIVIPSLLTVVMFVWGTRIYIRQARAPSDAMEIYVVGKQWMWKIQHPEGRREINELHVPVGRPIKLTITSEDVIHDFGIPAFRLKKDAVPGRYTTEWFQATRVGQYHLFCDQYCGVQHAGMTGTIYVMEPAKYEAWLSGSIPDEPPAQAGQKLFASLGCATCHSSQAPTMAGLYMSQVNILDRWGRPATAIADNNYLRSCILDPRAKVVVGYQGNLMPSFDGRLSEEQLVQIIAYIKSLQFRAAPSQAASPPPTQPLSPSTQPSPLLGK